MHVTSRGSLAARRAAPPPPRPATKAIAPLAARAPLLTPPRVTSSSSSAATSTSELGWRTDFSEEFRIQHLLGKGSYGTVRLGIHKSSGVHAAVKTLSKERGRLGRDKTLRKIRREVAVLQRLQGVNGVVRTHGVYDDGDDVHIVTDVAWGGDLSAFVKQRGCLDEPSLGVVAAEVLRTIAGFHAAGYLHGDVKPGNFVIAVPCRDLAADLPECGLAAVDLGCARPLSRGRRFARATGTPLFMAPEVFREDFGAKADVWALGVMLYWMYDGTYPVSAALGDLRGCRIDDVAAAVRASTPAFDPREWAGMPADGLDFMRLVLEVDEGKRPSPRALLRHPWIVRHAARARPPAPAQTLGPAIACIDDAFFL